MMEPRCSDEQLNAMPFQMGSCQSQILLVLTTGGSARCVFCRDYTPSCYPSILYRTTCHAASSCSTVKNILATVSATSGGDNLCVTVIVTIL